MNRLEPQRELRCSGRVSGHAQRPTLGTEGQRPAGAGAWSQPRTAHQRNWGRFREHDPRRSCRSNDQRGAETTITGGILLMLTTPRLQEATRLSSARVGHSRLWAVARRIPWPPPILCWRRVSQLGFGRCRLLHDQWGLWNGIKHNSAFPGLVEAMAIPSGATQTLRHQRGFHNEIGMARWFGGWRRTENAILSDALAA